MERLLWWRGNIILGEYFGHRIGLTSPAAGEYFSLFFYL
jgi:hypothetical protein